MAKTRRAHVFRFRLVPGEHRKSFVERLARGPVEMVEVVHVRDDDGIHGNNVLHGQRQFHQRIGTVVPRRRNGGKRSLPGKKRIHEKTDSAEGDDAGGTAYLLKQHVTFPVHFRRKTGKLKFFFNYFFAALRPLATTMRAVPTSANTAIHMVACPLKVRAKNSAFTPRASAMFCIRMA